MRLAHLLCDMQVRYRMVELTDGNSFSFPITQTDPADVTGLRQSYASEIPVTRIDSAWRRLVAVRDTDHLKNAAQFSGAYLHLDRVHDGMSVGHRAGDLV